MRSAGAMLRRLWPQRLAGQMIGLLLVALILAQAINVLIFMDERRAAIRSIERTQILERTASLIRLIESSPPVLHNQMLEAASSHKLYFWFSEASSIPENVSHDDNELRDRLNALLGEDNVRDLRIVALTQRGSMFGVWPFVTQARSETADIAHAIDVGLKPMSLTKRDDPKLLIATRLHNGQWLNVGLGVNPLLWRLALPTLLFMALAAAGICAIVVLMVRRITSPLARLADAAERVGRGETIEPISEDGPLDIRQTVNAFNRMYDRLQRFVQDRTRMLAAISHDLRTPITSLRLRAELIEDEEARTKILETLEEMQRMTEATLAFSRHEAAKEPSRMIDLAALIDSVCEDFTDIGRDVTFDGADRAPYMCRPVSLKRAIRNLLDNALAYGQRARVTLQRSCSKFRIVIQDDGPGIPEQDFERVFSPFVRLEESRNQSTGGIGLGLAIARTIIRNHGGDISLANRPEGGLLVSVFLPESESLPIQEGG